MSGIPSKVSARLSGTARALYTDHLRRPLALSLFDQAGYPLLTRQRLYDDPPTYVADFAEFFSPETVRIGSPCGVGPVPERLDAVVREWQFPQPFVAVLDNVDLVGPKALPIAPDGSFIIEAATGSALRVTDALVRSIIDGVAPVNRGTGDRGGTVVSFAGPWSDQFFHWFADYLPRLRVLREYERTAGVTPQVLVPPDPPSWLTDSLTALGVAPDRRTEWRGGRYSVDRLVVPSMPRHTRSTAPPEGYVHSPRELEWVRNELLATVSEADAPDVGRRLYVSRSRQPTRHVRNEADLLSVAGEYGFEIIYPEDWSFAEQLAAFARADAVLGPHGAGLFNAVYGGNTTLVELFGERTNPCYFAIADGLKMPYFMTRCEPVGDDMRVDPDDLDALLNLALDA